MNIFAWILIGWLALGAIVTVATVGRPKPPTTPATAAIGVVVTAGLIWLIVLAAA